MLTGEYTIEPGVLDRFGTAAIAGRQVLSIAWATFDPVATAWGIPPVHQVMDAIVSQLLILLPPETELVRINWTVLAVAGPNVTPATVGALAERIKTEVEADDAQIYEPDEGIWAEVKLAIASADVTAECTAEETVQRAVTAARSALAEFPAEWQYEIVALRPTD
jgi:hypothetical protein